MTPDDSYRELLRKQYEWSHPKEPRALTACRNLCRLLGAPAPRPPASGASAPGAPLEAEPDEMVAELDEQACAVTVRRGERSWVLLATEDGWRSHPICAELELPLDMTVRLAKRLHALLTDDDPGGPASSGNDSGG